MKKVIGAAIVLVGILLLVPSPAAACKSCSILSFWDPNCNHSGCTYCAACSICCGGDPGAGGNCAIFCGGAALTSTGTSLSAIFQPVEDASRPTLPFLAAPTAGGCSSASQ
jgi:hypothetical protein